MKGAASLQKLNSITASFAETLDRFGRPLRKALFFNLADERIYPAKVVVAALDKGMLSAAYGLRLMSRITIRGVKEFPFEDGRYPQPEVVASSLALAMNDFGASKTEVSLCIPKAWFVITEAEFPATVKENLSAVVSYELDRLTPFTAEEAYYDFRILGEQDGKISVLVAAAKADVIRPYIDALTKQGIAVKGITMNLSGFETLCRYANKKTEEVFLEIRHDCYHGALFLDGAISAAFTATFSKEDEKTKIEALKGHLAPLLDLLKEKGKKPLITASMSNPAALSLQFLKDELGCPVRMLDEINTGAGITAGKISSSCTAVGGVMEYLWPRADSLNLIRKGRHEQTRTPKALTALLLLAIFSLLVVYFVAPLRIEERRLLEMDRQIDSRKEEVRKVEALKKEVESARSELLSIEDFKGQRPLALNILKELTSILPKNAWLSRMKITKTTVDIEGYAGTATGLLSKLEASSLFRKAEFASPTFRDTRLNSDRFNIKMELEGVKQDTGKGGEKDEGTEE